MRLHACGVFVATISHVEKVKTIVKPLRSKHLGFSTLVAALLPAFRREHILEKRPHPTPLPTHQEIRAKYCILLNF